MGHPSRNILHCSMPNTMANNSLSEGAYLVSAFFRNLDPAITNL